MLPSGHQKQTWGSWEYLRKDYGNTDPWMGYMAKINSTVTSWSLTCSQLYLSIAVNCDRRNHPPPYCKEGSTFKADDEGSGKKIQADAKNGCREWEPEPYTGDSRDHVWLLKSDSAWLFPSLRYTAWIVTQWERSKATGRDTGSDTSGVISFTDRKWFIKSACQLLSLVDQF